MSRLNESADSREDARDSLKDLAFQFSSDPRDLQDTLVNIVDYRALCPVVLTN